MADNKQSAIIMVQGRRQVLQGPPSILGWSNLVEPDSYQGEAPQFKSAFHLNEAGAAAFGDTIQEHCIEALWSKFQDQYAESYTKLLEAAQAQGPASLKKFKLAFPVSDPSDLTKPDGRDWVERHLKDPKPGGKMDQPFLQFSNKADYKDKKTGKIVRKTMYAVDAKNGPLDLKALHLGMGSKVQALLMPGLFMNALINTPTPTLKLQGVKVLQVVSFEGRGAGAPLPETTDAELQEILGADFEAEDLSAFAKGFSEGPRAGTREGGSTDTDDDGDEFGDDIPF